jgi:hypothetical protein
MPTIDLAPRLFRGILSEADGGRSRENQFLSRGKQPALGQVAKVEPRVSLTTTADTHLNTVLDGLARTEHLVDGDIYDVVGTGIPAGTTFTYAGASAGTLSAAATANRQRGRGNHHQAGRHRPMAHDIAAGVSVHAVDATNGAKMALLIACKAVVDLSLFSRRSSNSMS